jgi:aminoglycoside 3-N-acetyltransferase
MHRSIVTWLLGERRKRSLKTALNAAKVRLVSTFRSYDAGDLKAALRAMGVAPHDTLMVHGNFSQFSGFVGSPADVVAALMDSVSAGNLMMVSIPFRGYAYDYLREGKPFNVKRTVSLMGLITEVFRRQKGVVRSLHPTHPVLVYGKDAKAIAAGHEDTVYPTGAGTPFAKLCELDGKVLLFDVGFGAITLFHYVEDVLKEKLPCPLYDDELFAATVIDADEKRRTVRTYAFAKGVVRHQQRLGAELRRLGKSELRKVGNSTLTLVKARDVVDTMSGMLDSGVTLVERRVDLSDTLGVSR